MKIRLKKAIVLVLVIQVVLFGLAIFGGKTIQSLGKEYLNILDNRVLLRKNYINDEMLQYRSNMITFENYIQKEVKELGMLEDLSLIPELLDKVVNRTAFTLRQSDATEIFLILEGQNGHEGVYLRDLDPKFNNIDNSDILMERGSIEIGNKIGASLDSYWAYKFNLEERDHTSQYYYKPFNAGNSYPNRDIEDLGYWSKPFRLDPEDIKILTYSIPLRDEEGNSYGVIGIGLTEDYFSAKLKYDELVENKRGAYLLSINNIDRQTTEKVVSSGPMFNKITCSPAIENEKKDFENIYKIKASKVGEKDIYASSKYLSLYNKNTPFENNVWSLTGFVSENDLFRPIEKIIKAILLYLIISLGLGILAAYLVSDWFMKPINKLMKSVVETDPEVPLRLAKTNILEIDELGQAIVTLNDDVLESASKVSKIINMVDVPIGAFEYKLKENKAFYTNTLFDILDIEDDKTKNYIGVSYLEKIIDGIMQNPESDIPNIYRYTKKDGTTSWLKLIIREEKSRVLGVIEDVSDEVISKRKTEYERDHDILTNLYNRRAFETKVKKIIQETNSGYSAFVMWDLDNLKYINDTYGHEYGDKYIKKAASVLNEAVIYNTIVARMSGDEFYIFIYDYKEKEEIRNIINIIKSKLNNTFLEVPDGESIRIRASLGISWCPDDSKKYDELIKYSDFAMYEVKHKDKGSIGEFTRTTYDKNSILLHGKEELNHFIDQKLVKYEFQPIVDVKKAEIFAYEALMRPQTKKLKSPYDVIRLAQSQSKLYEIEKLTLNEAMSSFVEQYEHFKDAKVFINSIPNYVLLGDDLKLFEEKFTNYLHRIVVEITENEQSDEECTKIKQEMLSKWGGDLALDDFGSGYNSELSLLILSPKYVKIDMNIIRGIDTDLNRQKLLKNMLSYAKNREIKIIAEGIETRGEMDKLLEFGVDYMQGYYLGMPKEIPETLDTRIKSEIESFYKEG